MDKKSTMVFTREDTSIMKGVAILMMIYFHMFEFGLDSILYLPLSVIGKYSIECYLARACNPVALFLLLGGIGNYIIYHKNQSGVKRTGKRVLKLYVHYWFSLLIFIPIILLLQLPVPISFKDFIWNITGLNPSWKISNWFLMPYCVVLLCSPWLFKALDRYGWKICLIVCLLIRMGVFAFNHYYSNEYIYANKWIWNPLPELVLLFAFMLGAAAAKTDFWGVLAKMKKWPGYLLYLALIIIIGIRCSIHIFTAFATFSLALCMLYVAAPHFSAVKKALIFLGKHSMNMWFVHWWIWDLVAYTGKLYSPVAFVLVVGLSAIVSMIFNFILKPVDKLILR